MRVFAFSVFILRRFPLLCLFIAALSAGAYEDPRPGRMLSPSFAVEANTPDEIRIRWQFDEDDGDIRFHQTLIAAPGPAQTASATVETFVWTRDDGASGDETDFFDQNPNMGAPRVSVREIGMLQGVRIAAVELRLSRGPGDGEEIRFSEGEIVLPFDHPDQAIFDSFSPEIAEITNRLLLNRPIRRLTPESAPQPSRITEEPEAWVKLKASQSGLIEISAEELLKRFTAPPDIISLSALQAGAIAPLAVVNNSNELKTSGVMRPDDKVFIHAAAAPSAFATETVVWLSSNVESAFQAKRLPESDGDTGARYLHREIPVEQDLLFIDGKPADERQNDGWMWLNLFDKETAPVTINLAETPLEQESEIAFRFVIDSGYAETLIKHVTPHVNGLIYPLTGTRQSPFIQTRMTLAAGTLQATNSISFKITEPTRAEIDLDALYLDRIQLRYAAPLVPGATPFHTPDESTNLQLPSNHKGAFWISSQPDSPIAYAPPGQLTIRTEGEGLLYLAPEAGVNNLAEVVETDAALISDLLDARQADVILIAPPEWHGTLAPFVDSLRQDGFTTRVLSTQAIYDAFGDGRLSPFAIRDGLRWACQNWTPPAPAYVLLVGDATWDYHDRYGIGVNNHLPGYREHADYAVENWFARLDGDDDKLQDVMLARWPVRSTDELAIVIDKTIAYKTDPPLGGWLNHVFVATDHGFERYTEELIDEWIPPAFRLTQRHIADYPLVDNIYLPARLRLQQRAKTSLKATEDIVSILSGGVWLWQFFGHGAPNVVGNERMFFGGGSKYTDVKKLTNSGKPFIMWSYSCETATFDYPRAKWNISIGEDLLTHPNGGAVGLLGATGRGYPHDHIQLARGMHEAAFHYGFSRMGQILLAGNLLALARQAVFEPNDQFAYLGDPTLRIPRFEQTSVNARLQGDEVMIQTDSSIKNDIAHAALWVRDASGTIAYATQTQMNTEQSDTLNTGDASLPCFAGVEFISSNDARPLVQHGVQRIDPPARGALIESTTGVRPDLAVIEDSIRLTPLSPRSGETVFIDLTIENKGVATAENVFIQGYQGERGKTRKPFEVVVGSRGERIERLDPGEQKNIRLRWDPTGNKGPYELEVKLDPFDQIKESDEENNSAVRSIDVRRKADILVVEDEFILKPIEDGKRFEMGFTLKNQGESDADKILVEMAFAYRESGKRVSGFVPDIISIKAGGRYVAGGIRIPSNIEYFELIIDPDEVVDEETHDNNRFRYEVE